MTKPPTSVRSIRLPDSLWAELSAEARRLDISVNALISAGGKLALERSAPISMTRGEIAHAVEMLKPGRVVRVLDDGASDFVPLISRPAFNPQPKPGKR